MLVRRFAALVFAAPMFAQSPSAESAVRTVVPRYMDARDRQDASSLKSLFTPDADQLVSSGEWRKGRDAVVKGTIASSQATGGKRAITVTSVRFLSPTVALADGRYDLTGLAGGEARHMWTSLVLVKSGANWKIEAIRNMLPAPPAK